MISAWTKHLTDEEDKEKFRNKILSSKVVLQRIKDLMEEDLLSVESDEIDVKAYENANWAYRQAHRNGYKNALRKLNILLDLKDSNTSDRKPTPRPGQ